MNQWTKEEVFTSVIQSIPHGLKVQMENKKSKSKKSKSKSKGLRNCMAS